MWFPFLIPGPQQGLAPNPDRTQRKFHILKLLSSHGREKRRGTPSTAITLPPVVHPLHHPPVAVTGWRKLLRDDGSMLSNDNNPQNRVLLNSDTSVVDSETANYNGKRQVKTISLMWLINSLKIASVVVSLTINCIVPFVRSLLF